MSDEITRTSRVSWGSRFFVTFTLYMGNVKIIAASAGSGKTYRLAYEYVRSVVENPSLYRHILAVTFTNKATEEMSSRILERLHELATVGTSSPYLKDLKRDLGYDEAKIRERAKTARGKILHDYSRFAVLTIDRFFQRLVRAFMRELGIDGGFDLELETDSLLELAADALIDEAATDGKVRERIFAAARDRLEEGKRWDIREPLVALGSVLFGEEYQKSSGDDTQRASSVIEAVVEKAAGVQADMTARARDVLAVIDRAGLATEDFKGRSNSFVSWLSKIAAGAFIPFSAAARNAVESDDPSAWVVKTSPYRGVIEGLIPTLRPMLAELGTLYSENSRLVASARLLGENRHNFLLLSDLQRHVERICREENIVPISETNRMIARLVSGNDTPFIFERAGSYFSRFLIDEFQDTSQTQWENFVPLIRNAIASEEGAPVMLIGDVKQAIYRWRGSDWRILSRRVREEMGAGRVDTETLDTNHRSMRRVVEFNNDAIGKVVEMGSAALDGMLASACAEGSLSNDEAAELTGMLAEAYRGHTQIPHSDVDEGYVTLTVYGSDVDGNYIPPVVERIEELQLRGYRAGDIAVLVRSNTQGARVAQMLLQRKRENPSSSFCYDVVTAEALTVGASAASRFIVACLSIAVDSPDSSIQLAVFNRWLGRDFDAPLNDGEAAFFARIAALSPEEAFEETVLRFGLQDYTDDIAYIQAIHGQITTFSSRNVADLPLFLKWWNERGATASITMQDASDAITVSTIHKAKGLQYKVVVVPYLSWSMTPENRGRPLVLWSEAARDGLDGAGTIPINYKKEMSGSYFSERYYREQVLAHIDAANLFYVAVTRAEQELHLMVSSNPHDGRNGVGNLLRSAMGITEDFAEWGAPVRPIQRERPENNALRSYPTSRHDSKIRLRLPSARYFGGENAGEDNGIELSPRDYGVLMHRVFENAATEADVHRTLGRMMADALISPDEHDRLQKIIERAFANPLVAGWFSEGWQTVRNEGDILTPGLTGTKRPDRVMMRDKKAVVVDYKFGLRTPPAHAAQLRSYMRLLGEMGYDDIEGYLWYVSLDRIEPVLFT